jgi:hypothetical protein
MLQRQAGLEALDVPQHVGGKRGRVGEGGVVRPIRCPPRPRLRMFVSR